MSYQALARKWRPRLFSEVVGQEHIVSALSHALDSDRVHHAFLFTGTRGVGKTTLARVLAKCLNCQRGVSSTPCNECDACQGIDEGRFIDLIEVDAASRTKVDDTRELLDNVQYAPSRGRYKVYLIDEVHMLSGHSFNALLKTLEEPPPHVKFLLATTDPQKLPVTVLSRCLQFHLKALQPEQITGQLEKILTNEGVDCEGEALKLIARAADGSMRDALSLLDQAISYGGGSLRSSDVRGMLGTIETDYVRDLLYALAKQDADAGMAQVERIAERSRDYGNVLDELLVQLYHVSLAQLAPGVLDAKQVREPWHDELARLLAPEEVQLYYQIGLIGKRDLPLAPDPRSGFEMILLRMLAFLPTERTAVAPSTPSAPPPPAANPSMETTATGGEDWAALAAGLPINGLVRELALNTTLDRRAGTTFHLVLDRRHEHLLAPERVQTLEQALGSAVGAAVTVKLRVGESANETPAEQRERVKTERQQAAEREIWDDPTVQDLMERFEATLVDGSIRPRGQ